MRTPQVRILGPGSPGRHNFIRDPRPKSGRGAPVYLESGLANAINRAFQRRAIPLGQLGGCRIGSLKKRKQRLIRRGLRPQIVIFKNELAERGIVARGFGRDGLGVESGRSRRGVAIECGFPEAAVSRAKSRH